jgi:hypothetical protein
MVSSRTIMLYHHLELQSKKLLKINMLSKWWAL